VTGLPLDLTSCDREPIHLPGCIQPHGVLFAVSTDDLSITAVSANAARYFDLDVDNLLGMPLSHLLDASSVRALAAVSRERSDVPFRLSCHPSLGSARFAWQVSTRASADSLLLEAELLPADADVASLALFENFEQASQRLMASADAMAVHDCLVEEMRQLTGYGRVMMYRFAPDWSGEVIAEASDGTMASYLGLHFPASDIPVQARALYARNAGRQIPDVHYEPVPLLQIGQSAIDLSGAGLRSVSPMHLAYLRNMVVGASFSISILHNGRLWGLVACHHPSARRVTPELRRSCALIAQIAMARRSVVEEAEVARPSIAVKALEARLLIEASDSDDNRDVLHADLLRRNSGALLDLLAATGMALSSSSTTTLLGQTPPEARLKEIFRWLGSRASEAAMPEMLATDHLGAVCPACEGLGEAAGILALPFGEGTGNFIVWFRPEIARVITWAGDPTKPVDNASGQDILTPRQSFAAWTVQARGRARPWTNADIAAANSLRNTLLAIVALRSSDLQRINAQLRHSNEELESFAYIASHDLKEPLRQIEVFASLLERAYGRDGSAPEKIDRWFTGIGNSSRRLRVFIDRLAAYARLGIDAQAFAPTDLNAILSAVVQDFAGQIAEANGTVNVSPLPVVMCDGTQIRQVLQNLVGNAVKYRHTARPLVLNISAEQQPAPANSRQPGLPILALRIADNGIGFEERHCEQIFKPFERLHSFENYAGSGLGLAICRQVIARHGGSISATGRLGEGAVFTVILPLRPLTTHGALPE